MARGSVGWAYTLVIYFLKSNEEIVVRNPKSKTVFIIKIYSLLSHLSRSLGSLPSLRGFRGARLILMHDNVLLDMSVSLLALSIYTI